MESYDIKYRKERESRKVVNNAVISKDNVLPPRTPAKLEKKQAGTFVKTIGRGVTEDKQTEEDLNIMADTFSQMYGGPDKKSSGITVVRSETRKYDQGFWF